MKKKLLFLFLGILVLGLIVFLIFSDKERKIDIKKTEKRDLKPGEFELIKMTNGGVPYKWEVSISNNNVKFVEMYSVALNDSDGGPVEEHYIFKGAKEGETVITFKYISVVNGEEYEDRRSSFNIKIDKDLKSTIKE